jgi:hypothetical protein
LLIDNKDKSELDFFRYLKPLRKEHKENVKAQVRRKFRAAVKKFIKKYKENKNCLPNALVALQDIMKERRKKQREILHLQRINTIKYLQEKSPLIHPSQDISSTGVNMFINQTIQNQYNFHNFSYQPQFNIGNDPYNIGAQQPRPQYADNFQNNRENEELEMLRKMDEEARKEKMKTNQNLSKLLSLIEVHNSTLEEIENKFKKEFMDIKSNIKKIKTYQKEQEKLRAEKALYQKATAEARKPEPSPYVEAPVEEVKEVEKPEPKAVKKTSAPPKDTSYEQTEEAKRRKESEQTLQRLYPKVDEPTDNDLIEDELQKADDVGLLTLPQDNSKLKHSFEDEKPRKDSVKKNAKKKNSEISKNQSLKAPRDSRPVDIVLDKEEEDKAEQAYASNYTNEKVMAPQQEYKPVISKEPTFDDEVQTPGLEKMESNTQILKDEGYADKEIELTDEEEFDKELEQIPSPPRENFDIEPDVELPEKRVKNPPPLNLHEPQEYKEEQKKLSEVSFDDSSIEDNNEVFSDEDNKLDFEENMPRLNEEGVIVGEGKKAKKKRRARNKKSSKPTLQEMDVMMREQVNKKEKAQLAKNSKAKKSYHAYLEHPRLKHQASIQSPRAKAKAEEVDPLGLAPRPKKK